MTVHCYSSVTARSRRPCSQPTQWKRYGSWPTALSHVAARYTGGKEIQPKVVLMYCCLGSTGAQHSSFYALTTLFPSISQYKWNHTRADKQDSDSDDDLIFSPIHLHYVKWPIPWVLSALIVMALTRIYAPSLLLCCSSWPTVWILTTVITWPTLTNPFWPAATLSMINL